MSKRILLVMTLGLLSLGLFAESQVSGTTLDSIGNAELPMLLDLSDGDGATKSYEFGFSATEVAESTDKNNATPITSLNFSMDTTSTGIKTAKATCYMYWKIYDADLVSVYLKGDSALTFTPVSGGGNSTIDWVATWKSKTLPATGATETAVDQNIQKDDYTSQVLIYQRESGAKVGNIGSTLLTVVTEPILNKAPGQYKANLTMKIEG